MENRVAQEPNAMYGHGHQNRNWDAAAQQVRETRLMFHGCNAIEK
jgi:hypothetical protein